MGPTSCLRLFKAIGLLCRRSDFSKLVRNLERSDGIECEYDAFDWETVSPTVRDLIVNPHHALHSSPKIKPHSPTVPQPPSTPSLSTPCRSPIPPPPLPPLNNSSSSVVSHLLVPPTQSCIVWTLERDKLNGRRNRWGL